MLRKFAKCFLGLVVIGTVIGILYAYFSGRKCSECEEPDYEEDSEEDDFDLDSVLEPAVQREYVPLNHTKSTDDTTEEPQE